MLIVYRTDTGDVVDNTGTSTAWPEGPPDELAFTNTDARHVPRTDLMLLRLHDERDAEQVRAALRNYHHVDTDSGTLVIEGPYPTLTVDRDSIPADGATAAVVTFESGLAPAEVSFDVNGEVVTEDVVDGTAAIEVVADIPGPVALACEGLTVTITATEVSA